MKRWMKVVSRTLLCGGLAALGGVALAADAAPSALAPQVSQAVRHDESRPMRDIVREAPFVPTASGSPVKVIPNIFPKQQQAGEILPEVREAARFGVQDAPTGTPAPSTIVSFQGLSNNGSLPPDTNGDVSPAHFI
jgi:hypothetical protein